MRYYFCPNLENKCYSSTPKNVGQNTIANTKVLFIKDTASQLGGTTIDFGLNDLCGWQVAGETDYTQGKVIKVKIEQLYLANCYLSNGYSISNASSETSCVAGTEYTYDAD